MHCHLLLLVSFLKILQVRASSPHLEKVCVESGLRMVTSVGVYWKVYVERSVRGGGWLKRKGRMFQVRVRLDSLIQ
jgi:hypothetical protein